MASFFSFKRCKKARGICCGAHKKKGPLEPCRGRDCHSLIRPQDDIKERRCSSQRGLQWKGNNNQSHRRKKKNKKKDNRRQPCGKQLTRLGLGGALPAGSRALVRPDVDGVDDSRSEAGQLVAGSICSDWDLPAGALGRDIAQHVAIDLCLHSVPCHSRCALGHCGRHQVGWRVYVCNVKSNNFFYN